MKVEFPPEEMFFRKMCMVGDEPCVLVTPKPGVTWSRQNSIFRSSLWDSKGESVNLGFRKFTRLNEKTDVFPDPKNLNNVAIVVKEDGSLLLVSFFKGHLIHRTRGTCCATTLKTGFEIPILKTKYPKAFDNELLRSEKVTLLYEWTGKNKIILDYGDEPDIILIGAINHDDYSHWKQDKLDELSKEIGVRRPKYYQFNSLEQMIETITALKGAEGCCIYFGDQIKKCKASEYDFLHSVKSCINSDKLASLWFEWDMPNYQDYCNKFESIFKNSTLTFALPAISLLFDAIKPYNEIMEHLRVKYLQRKDWSRKEFAIAANQEYGSTRKFSVLMNLYLGKETDKENLKGILLQNCKQREIGSLETTHKEWI